MSYLQSAIERMSSTGKLGLAKLPTTQPEIQRQFLKLQTAKLDPETLEDLRPFLNRCSQVGVKALRRHELNRILRGVWCDKEFESLGYETLKLADNDPRRSSEQAMIEGYLTYFPVNKPAMKPLALAAERSAKRHDWAWKNRAQKWDLFSPEVGTKKVAIGLMKEISKSSDEFLSQIGLNNQLSASGFGRAVLIEACHYVAKMQSPYCIKPQCRLLSLFTKQHQISHVHVVVQALLQPWLKIQPPKDHRKIISDFLLDHVGDPRMNRERWNNLIQLMSETVGLEKAKEIAQTFKRWLTEVAMSEFFRAIAKTTDRQDQWAQREKFWLAYLDEGVVLDAWPALGKRARYRIEEIIKESGERPEYGIMRSGPSSSSTIIMQIGDLRIAEWSDNGSCRFWSDSDPHAPQLYRARYEGTDLRTTSGRDDFQYESHVPASPRWESKFANIIYRRTNIEHPRFGRGYW